MGTQGKNPKEIPGERCISEGLLGRNDESNVEPLQLPWSRPSASVKGRQVETRILKDRGSKAHPNSGAGRIKWDGSDEESVIEVKDAKESYQVKKTLLRDLHKEASRQGKAAILIINMGEYQIEAIIRRNRNGNH